MRRRTPPPPPLYRLILRTSMNGAAASKHSANITKALIEYGVEKTNNTATYESKGMDLEQASWALISVMQLFTESKLIPLDSIWIYISRCAEPTSAT